MKTKSEAATNPRPRDRWEKKRITLAGVQIADMRTVKAIKGENVIYEHRHIVDPGRISKRVESSTLLVFARWCRYATYLGGHDE